jgi:hypothetical protein
VPAAAIQCRKVKDTTLAQEFTVIDVHQQSAENIFAQDNGGG